MENWLIEVMSEYGYIGILFLIAIENLFPPLPSEVILTFGGFMTTFSNLTIIGVVVSATIGSVIGAIILYIIGLQLQVTKIEHIVHQWGHILRLSVNDIHKAESWFTKYGAWTIFLCRFIPIVRSLISIPAGMAKMNIVLFILLTTLGTFIWNFILVYLGASVGVSWHIIVEYMDIYSNVLYVFLMIVFVTLVTLWMGRKNK